MSDDSYIGPESKVDVLQGEAPAGLFPTEGELPVIAVPGGDPATLGGYSPNGAQQSLPAPGSDDGNGLPPSGSRR